MSRLATIDHFIFDSDFPADMITYYKTDSFTIPANGAGTKTYNHSLGYAPLCFGVWATAQDFSNSRPLSDGYFNMIVGSTTSQVKLEYDFSTKNTPTNIYLRIYGYPPSTYTGFCPATAQSSKPLILNTDDSYSPLIFEGAFTTKTNSSASTLKMVEYNVTDFCQKQTDTANHLTIYHSLPYRPRVMLWGTINGTTKPASSATFDYWGGAATVRYPSCSFYDGEIDIPLGSGYSGEDIITTHVRVYA